MSFKILYLLYIAASGYLLILVSSTRPDVFYSADGGMKFMVVRQICAGEDFRYISHTQPEWVEKIWAQGYFPIREGYAVPGPRGNLFVFAPSFQIISAYFYHTFGYRGLYIIPFLSTLILWLWFILTAKKMNFSTGEIAIMFFVLAFCSPLTLYGAVYWEHTLAVLLLFNGVFFIVNPPGQPLQAAILGCISGLAAWIRPESLLMNMLLLGAVGLINCKKISKAHGCFALGMLAGTASFLIFNKLEYDAYFGVHGSQVLGNKDYFKNLRQVGTNIHWINWLLIKYFSIVVLLVPVLWAWLKFRWPLSTRTRALILVIIAFCIFAPFLFPNEGGKQWGPRFFLPLIPIVILVLFSAYKEWKNLDWGRYKWPLLVCAVLAIGYNGVLNTFVEAGHLRNDNLNRVLLALDYLRQDPGNIAVVNSPLLTMELGSLYREKNFFLASDSASLEKLINLLRQQGADHFVYINADGLPAGIAGLLSSHHVQLVNKGSYRVCLFPLVPEALQAYK